MEIPRKTLRNGMSLESFGLGTWRIGGRMERDPSNDDASDVASIKRAIDTGIRHIDTAELYAQGHAEELVAEAMAPYRRDDFFLVSKVSPQHHGAKDLALSLDASLRRLKTDYLDLYLLHRPNPDIPLEETIGALDAAIDAGKVRHIGVSNFGTQRMEKAIALSRHGILCNQVHLNLVVREAIVSGLHDACIRNDVFLIAWRPIEDVLEEGTDFLQPIAAKYGKTPAQIALNWVLSKQNVVTLATMRSPTHLQANLDALTWSLSPEDVETLDSEYPVQMEVSPTIPLL